MKIPLVGAAILAVLTALSACGQRGPLFLPKPPDVPKAETKRVPPADNPR